MPPTPTAYICRRCGCSAAVVRFDLGFRSNGGAPPIAFDVHLKDGGVVDQAIDGSDSQCLGKTGAVTSTATGVILEQMALIDASGEQRVALQVHYLPVALAGDTHVANQHVRKTLSWRFPCTISFRQGLSHRFAGQNIPTSHGAGLTTPHACNRLISLGDHVTPFQLCPLMRTSRAFRYFRPSNRLCQTARFPESAHRDSEPLVCLRRAGTQGLGRRNSNALVFVSAINGRRNRGAHVRYDA